MRARPRRWRTTPALRTLVRETRLTTARLVAPLFVHEGITVPSPVASMPGVVQWPLADVAREAQALANAGIPAVLLFGIPRVKDAAGSGAYDEDGVVPQAVRGIKAAVPSLLVITDVCLCEYTEHGHCGLLNSGDARTNPQLPKGYLLNDASTAVLARVALAHARAGADIVAPSAMLDGMVRVIRDGLDSADFGHIPILSYSAKYASSFYGPFREAAEGAPAFGDRKSHQMDCGNLREALREHALDVEQGADGLMVKPALAYLDVIHATRERFPDQLLAAYNVSGEYAMVKAAAAQGWLDERAAVLEVLTAIQRAGADLIITYHAREAAAWLQTGTEREEHG
jgi:porphobilinogen synthase